MDFTFLNFGKGSSALCQNAAHRFKKYQKMQKNNNPYVAFIVQR